MLYALQDDPPKNNLLWQRINYWMNVSYPMCKLLEFEHIAGDEICFNLWFDPLQTSTPILFLAFEAKTWIEWKFVDFEWPSHLHLDFGCEMTVSGHFFFFQ